MQIKRILTADETAVLQIYLVCRRAKRSGRRLFTLRRVIINVIAVLKSNA